MKNGKAYGTSFEVGWIWNGWVHGDVFRTPEKDPTWRALQHPGSLLAGQPSPPTESTGPDRVRYLRVDWLLGWIMDGTPFALLGGHGLVHRPTKPTAFITVIGSILWTPNPLILGCWDSREILGGRNVFPPFCVKGKCVRMPMPLFRKGIKLQ